MKRVLERKKKLEEIRIKYNIEIDSYTEYDDEGRIIYQRGPDGDYESQYEYDKHGNLAHRYDIDSDGFYYELHRIFNNNNELVQESKSCHHIYDSKNSIFE